MYVVNCDLIIGNIDIVPLKDPIFYSEQGFKM